MSAQEWRVMASSVVLRLEAWSRSREVARWKRGTLFWGSEERGGMVEVVGFVSGHVEAAWGALRATGRTLSWEEAEEEQNHEIPLMSRIEALRCVSAGWRSVFDGGSIAIRKSRSCSSQAVFVLTKGQKLVGTCSDEEDGWIEVLGPVDSGYVRIRTIKHGLLLRREKPHIDEQVVADVGFGVYITLRTSTTAAEIVELLRKKLPIVSPNLQIVVSVGGHRIEAPAKSTLFELGFRGGRLDWTCDNEFDPNFRFELQASMAGVEVATLDVCASWRISELIEKSLCPSIPGSNADNMIVHRQQTLRRVDVVEDTLTVWEAGLRPNGRIHFTHIGDLAENSLVFNTKEPQPSASKVVEVIESPAAVKTEVLSAAKLKERGDEAFRNGNFDKSIVEYSQCLQTASGSLALGTYRNRAAAYKQLGDHAAVARDCDIVLKTKPGDLKSLLRRAQALEALEDYEGALFDIEIVLATRRSPGGARKVGDKNAALCQLARQRLLRNVKCRVVENQAGRERCKRSAEARSRQEVFETIARDAAEARADIDAAIAVADYEEDIAPYIVTRGCGCPSEDGQDANSGKATTRGDDNIEHEATLIWLCEPELAMDGMCDAANDLARDLRLGLPGLKIVVVQPPSKRRLSPGLMWFDLDYDDWNSLLASEGRSKGCAQRLLRAQVNESVEWVARLLERELQIVDKVVIGGRDQGAVVATHVAATFTKAPIATLIALNGPTPLLQLLLSSLGPPSADIPFWTLIGSHHSQFSTDDFQRQTCALSARFENLTHLVVPYGEAGINRIDFAYVAAILSITIGRHSHEKNNIDEIAQSFTQPVPHQATSRYENKRHSRRCRCVKCVKGGVRTDRERKAIRKAKCDRLLALKEALTVVQSAMLAAYAASDLAARAAYESAQAAVNF